VCVGMAMMVILHYLFELAEKRELIDGRAFQPWKTHTPAS